MIMLSLKLYTLTEICARHANSCCRIVDEEEFAEDMVHIIQVEEVYWTSPE